MNTNPLMDKDFLRLLDLERDKEVYAKIISLDLNENPIEEITGKVSLGTINIDGDSAVRRTCSLTILNQNLNINDYHWGLSTKFSLAIGLKIPDHIRKISKVVSYEKENSNAVILNLEETIYPYEDFPEIVWFKLGIFLVTEFKVYYSTSASNVYISGKDKMCLLNGDIGGLFPSLTDLGVNEYVDENGDVTKTDNTLKSIIREMIHYYGGEPFHNIIINDLDNKGVELLDFSGDTLYLFKNVDTGIYENAIIDGEVPRYDSLGNKILVSEIENYDTIAGELVGKTVADLVKATKSLLDTTYYTVVKCSYGLAVGYRSTDLTYAGDLIANAGDSITSILDKIVNMLGEYEYFYNVEGQFIFQKKLTYINTSWNNIVKVEDDESYVESSKTVSQISYNFTDSNLITSFSNSPNFSNIKNDYSIWGKKKKTDSTGKDNYIHLRCAIDIKPEEYTQIKVSASDISKWKEVEPNFFEGLSTEGIENYIQDTPKIFSTNNYDWREIIYQMSVDYLKYNHLDDFEIRLREANPQYINGKTGYEQYYTDLNEFWRYLYNPEPDTDSSSDYYKSNYFCSDDEDTTDSLKYWNRLVATDPSSLRFWFDFVGDTGASLDKYSVAAIGDRPKVVNDDDVRAIYYGEIPTIIYITKEDYEDLKEADLLNDGYTYIILPETMEDYFSISSKNKSAQDELDELLFNYAYCNESISLTSMPIYYLLPNTKIGVYDSVANINGEYIINKITLPLTYNGTMSISATKAPIRLY